MTHTSPCRCITTHPIEDLKWCWIKNKIGKEWAHFLRELTNKVIRWYTKWNEQEEVWYRRVESIQLPFSNFPPIDDATQRPSLIKGKETVEGGNKEEDLQRELEVAYEGQK
ncbi:hypothetical protein CR513_09250, partial [Mucuna pruriens]